MQVEGGQVQRLVRLTYWRAGSLASAVHCEEECLCAKTASFSRLCLLRTSAASPPINVVSLRVGTQGAAAGQNVPSGARRSRRA